MIPGPNRAFKKKIKCVAVHVAKSVIGRETYRSLRLECGNGVA